MQHKLKVRSVSKVAVLSVVLVSQLFSVNAQAWQIGPMRGDDPQINPVRIPNPDDVRRELAQAAERARIETARIAEQGRLELERLAAREREERERVAEQLRLEAERIAAREREERERVQEQLRVEAARVAEQARVEAARVAEQARIDFNNALNGLEVLPRDVVRELSTAGENIYRETGNVVKEIRRSYLMMNGLDLNGMLAEIRTATEQCRAESTRLTAYVANTDEVVATLTENDIKVSNSADLLQRFNQYSRRSGHAEAHAVRLSTLSGLAGSMAAGLTAQYAAYATYGGAIGGAVALTLGVMTSSAQAEVAHEIDKLQACGSEVSALSVRLATNIRVVQSRMGVDPRILSTVSTLTAQLSQVVSSDYVDLDAYIQALKQNFEGKVRAIDAALESLREISNRRISQESQEKIAELQRQWLVEKENYLEDISKL